MPKDKKSKAEKAKAAAAIADRDIILEAYNDELKIVFHAFHNQLINKGGDAEANFTNGIAILRDARDRALKLI